MDTQLTAYSNGSMVWSCTYGGRGSGKDPVLQGTPPSAVTAALKNTIRQQRKAGGNTADVDYLYETTAEAARKLTGYRHDTDRGIVAISVLESSKAKRKAKAKTKAKLSP